MTISHAPPIEDFIYKDIHAVDESSHEPKLGER